MQVDGADIRGDQLLVHPGQVLTLQFVPITPEPCAQTSRQALSESPGEGFDPSHRDCGGSSSGQQGDSAGNPSTQARRSRSPRRHANGTPSTRLMLSAAPLLSLPFAWCLGCCALSSLRVIAFLVSIQAVRAEDGLYGCVMSPADIVQWALPLLAFCAQLGCTFRLWACKLLSEPYAHSAQQRHVLACLRYVAPRLGRAWRYTPPPDSFLILSDDEQEESEADVIEVVDVPCAVCAPGYATHPLLASLQLPATVPELLDAVQDTRLQEWTLRLPYLIPAQPQPCDGSALILACPPWVEAPDFTQALMCFDTSVIDRRVFAALGPAYVDRQRLIHLANLPGNLDLSVYVGSADAPLPEEGICHVVHGTTVLFLPSDMPFRPRHSLENMLLMPDIWAGSLTVPSPPAEGNYSLLHEADTILQMTQVLAPATYKETNCCLHWCSQRSPAIVPSTPSGSQCCA